MMDMYRFQEMQLTVDPLLLSLFEQREDLAHAVASPSCEATFWELSLLFGFLTPFCGGLLTFLAEGTVSMTAKPLYAPSRWLLLLGLSLAVASLVSTVPLGLPVLLLGMSLAWAFGTALAYALQVTARGAATPFRIARREPHGRRLWVPGILGIVASRRGRRMTAASACYLLLLAAGFDFFDVTNSLRFWQLPAAAAATLLIAVSPFVASYRRKALRWLYRSWLRSLERVAAAAAGRESALDHGTA